jgi:uncharacterized membrane protein (UPF0127 family)
MKISGHKKYRTVVVVLIVALIASISWLVYVLFFPQSPNLIDAKIGNTSIKVEEAKNDQEQARGLSNRTSLDANTGMLFKFNSPKIATFWMKGMKFPLDFIWIRDGKVVDLSEHIAAPLAGMSDDKLPIISPKVASDSVIEVNAGFVDFNKIQNGDKVSY